MGDTMESILLLMMRRHGMVVSVSLRRALGMSPRGAPGNTWEYATRIRLCAGDGTLRLDCRVSLLNRLSADVVRPVRPRKRAGRRGRVAGAVGEGTRARPGIKLLVSSLLLPGASEK